MKAEVKTGMAGFKPITVVLTFECKEDLQAMYHRLALGARELREAQRFGNWDYDFEPDNTQGFWNLVDTLMKNRDIKP